MSIKQVRQLKTVFGVVVFFGAVTCSGEFNISPSRLKAFVAKSTETVRPVSFAESEDWNIEMLSSDLDHFDQQLGAIEEKLDKHEDELAQVKKMITELQDRDPSHPYLLQLEEVKKALLMLKERLVEIEKSQRGAVNVDHRVNVYVDGNRGASPPAVSTAGYVFGKLCDAVKYFGPSIVNYYVISQAFALMREHRDAMMVMMKETHRLLAAQAVRADQAVPPQPQVSAPGIDTEESWLNNLASLVFILPFLYKILQEASLLPTKSDEEATMIPVKQEPKAWRTTNG